MNTSEEKEEKRKLSTCAVYVQVKVHVQSIINLVYINLVYIHPVFIHWVTNQQFLPREAAMLARSWDCNSVRLSVCPSVSLSVCLSVTRVLYDETKEHTADIFISHE